MAPTKQAEIIKALDAKPSIVADEEIRFRVDFLKDYLKQRPYLRALVLGISGGQDSTLAGKMCQIAVDQLNQEGKNEYSFIAIRLPYGVQVDEKDCQDALSFIKPSRTLTVNIKEAVLASERALAEAGIELSDFVKGNEKARERMKAQYSVAAMTKGIVIGTDHAAEAVTGFYTKYGDGGSDLNPLHGLNKRQGQAMLKSLKCPNHLYTKVPTADLEDDKPALPDETALGITYSEIDDYLEGKIVSEKAQATIEAWYMKSQHKRQLPVTPYDKKTQ
ncbi:NH(3)-dependent NAD(+) synthetase [Gregarina niphandrodes]|uniref:NH(3)-dependent NAD(+) synthetase n=1 Tax=Gregarina niphandrodes TaxID=110365 RepID=A0A023B6V9_GRENI|nr:NH(3)-dependent NAD(+) synthetase [Gregarina niphandrodes]EZG66768.1 NH(3)-dependent NAD(+) synthetase [Gregarina niphandrodes]|eukprot:XP_011130492.1 NH(3)-dependent NAD(+) synthetase [Gregarina niphandrodes]